MQLNTIDDLIQALAFAPYGALRPGMKTAWRDGSLVAWLETRAFHSQQPDSVLLGRIQELAKRLSAHADLGLFALLQTLAPSRPLELATGVLLDAPEHIESVIAAHPKQRKALMAALTQCVANGRLAEWVAAARFTNWQALIDRLAALPKDPIEGLEHLPGYAVRWQFSNRAPFPTGDTEAEGPAVLATWIDSSPERRALGLTLLKSGWLDLWLVTAGRLKRGDLDGLRSAQCSSAARVEMLLRWLDSKRPPAKVQVEPDKLEIGHLAPEAGTSRTLTLKTQGRGYVWGTCALEGNPLGMRVEPLSFDGIPAQFKLIIDSRGVPPFTTCSATLAINCYDGAKQHQLRVPVRYDIRIPLAPKIARSLLAGGIAGALMVGLRLWAGAVLAGPSGANQPLRWISFDWVKGVFDHSFESFMGIALPGFALFGVLIAIFIYLVRACNR